MTSLAKGRRHCENSDFKTAGNDGLNQGDGMNSSLSPCSSQGFYVAGYQVWFQALEHSQKLNLNTHLLLSPREQ